MKAKRCFPSLKLSFYQSQMLFLSSRKLQQLLSRRNSICNLHFTWSFHEWIAEADGGVMKRKKKVLQVETGKEKPEKKVFRNLIKFSLFDLWMLQTTEKNLWIFLKNPISAKDEKNHVWNIFLLSFKSTGKVLQPTSFNEGLRYFPLSICVPFHFKDKP